MAGPGRKRKPTKTKQLEGTYRKDRSVNEPEPAPCIPIPPDCLDDIAIAEWRRIAPQLYELGLLSEIDMAALAGYCQSFSLWNRESKLLKEESAVAVMESGNVVQNPRIGVVNRALDQMRKFLVEFGMTPSSRSGVRASIKPKGNRFSGHGI